MLHCVQVKFGANELRIQIYVFTMRVSVGKIRKFDPKFERKTIRRSIFFFRRGGNDGGEGAD
ncbi:hypothetical protein [Campylobacter rectus]